MSPCAEFHVGGEMPRTRSGAEAGVASQAIMHKPRNKGEPGKRAMASGLPSWPRSGRRRGCKSAAQPMEKRLSGGCILGDALAVTVEAPTKRHRRDTTDEDVTKAIKA